MRFRSLVRVTTVAAALAVVATACGGGTSSTTGGGSPSPHNGGSITVGAEQWPQCLNPITSCSFSSWAYYTTIQELLPRAVEWDLNGQTSVSPLITEVPSEDNGGIVNKPFTVTYHLNPDAKWSDGTPITSEDFDFTWKAILYTKGTVSTTGYNEITSIDTSDPQTVVINFSKVFVDWPDLFGGAFGFVIEKSQFPNADPDKPDLSAEMQTSYSFSGGPWILKSWDKQTEVLVKNPNYFGKVPYLDQVTFIRRQEQATEITSLLSGEVAAIYPQPSDVSLLDQFNQNSAVQSIGGNSNYDEALWLNLDKPPVNDPKVREALMYAVDRQSVIDGVIKLNNPEAEVLNCGVIWFPGTPWCDPNAFAKYTYDPEQSKSILESDGYDCSSTPCTKNGEQLTIEYTITAGNSRRAATAAIVKENATPAGFNLDVKTRDPTDLFSNGLSKGDYVMAEYASGGGYDPTMTATFACDQIPTAQNGYSGGNTDRWCNEKADAVMHKSDEELNMTKRVALIKQIAAYEAQDIPAVPLFVLPNVSAWRTDKVAGPVGEWNSSGYGLFFNMEDWYTP